jgi:pentatricopeptide repeat protein
MDLLGSNILLGTALIDMHAKFGVFEKAHQVLESLPIRDTVTWNALISGYAEEDCLEDALSCFQQMQTEGLIPNDVTFICILKACGKRRGIEKGEQIHAEIVRCGLLKNIVLATALVDMYAKCGIPSKGLRVLDGLPNQDIWSWSAVIAGYVQAGKYHEALHCFQQLQREGFIPNEVTLVCILKVCGEIGALNMGKVIHAEIENRGLLAKNILLGNALVDMYAKCGLLAKSRQVLEELPLRDAASYNALMTGYAQEGQGHEVHNCFIRMQTEGIRPDEITFVCVLSACSHTGNSDDAQIYYDNMTQLYGIAPTIEHHTCMVFAFGYTGCFHKAMSVIRTMPSYDDSSVWLALLTACRRWGNVKLGRLAFDQAILMQENLASACVLMANIYAVAGMQEEADEIEAMRGEHLLEPVQNVHRQLDAF